MNNKGFTLVELMAVLVIVGALSIILIPGYITVYSSIKRSNVQSKISQITNAAYKYGNSIKDDIKILNIGDDAYLNNCMKITIAELIQSGYIESEYDYKDAIKNPVENADLDGNIYMCYCNLDYDISVYYVQDYKEENYYYTGDYVAYENKLYYVTEDYKGNGELTTTTQIADKNSSYNEDNTSISSTLNVDIFEEITSNKC